MAQRNRQNTLPVAPIHTPTTRSASASVFSPSNSLQQRRATQTNFGKSPISLSDDEKGIHFDYNVFVMTWQDQIKMRQFNKCEKYCREVIEKLLVAETQRTQQTQSTLSARATAYQFPDDDVHTLLEYRSKVHFSLAYLLKKYFKRFDEARNQYEESIKTDKENPGAHFNLANMLVDVFKDFTTAEYHFKRAIELEPSYALYRMTYAEFLWHDCHRHDDSAAQYEQLVQYYDTYSGSDEHVHPNEDIYFNYGLLLRDHLHDIPNALRQFERVLQLNADDKEATEEYAYTLQQQQQQKKIQKEQKEQDELEDTVSISLKQQYKQNLKSSKNSKNSFRRSQHEIVLPNFDRLVSNDTSDVGMAAIVVETTEVDTEAMWRKKYNLLLDERNKLNKLLKLQEKKQKVVQTQLTKMKQFMEEKSNKTLLRREMNLMVKNGPSYVARNTKKAHKIMRVCKNILGQLDVVYKNDGQQNGNLNLANSNVDDEVD
eukprot:CAMPEP_0202700084 /NCGR_PEP_ID=MMETSP1385-20130828/13298_1 /ASSEMBLY_ACC=CAM_ASM_000861 /TAXON_ID=933848 /ORGANISM="Elphidium margaritaceum" /LENGTH=485 /DNA_ID=CAMNT_0049357193 /DNA_START=21 /DNA_END=1478 /DNA_ORIENTATION=-